MWRKDLDAGLKKKIGDWLFSYGKADAGKKVLADLQWAPFKKSDNNQLLPIRQIQLNKEIMKRKGDEKVAATIRRRNSPSSKSSSPTSATRSRPARNSRAHL